MRRRRGRWSAAGISSAQTIISLQTNGGEPETPWVESGYRQGDAGPRPFMEEALRDFVDSSEAEAIVVSALLAAGFEVEAS